MRRQTPLHLPQRADWTGCTSYLQLCCYTKLAAIQYPAKFLLNKYLFKYRCWRIYSWMVKWYNKFFLHLLLVIFEPRYLLSIGPHVYQVLKYFVWLTWGKNRSPCDGLTRKTNSTEFYSFGFERAEKFRCHRPIEWPNVQLTGMKHLPIRHRCDTTLVV